LPERSEIFAARPDAGVLPAGKSCGRFPLDDQQVLAYSGKAGLSEPAGSWYDDTAGAFDGCLTTKVAF